jgi:hypothetical protein
MNMSDFFPRDPAKALVELKETLYERLGRVQGGIDENGKNWQLYMALMEERDFLRDLLDKIERS